jgi:hypothetical protein
MSRGTDYFFCEKCGDACKVDGNFPKYFCWCDTCNDYARGFEEKEYAADEIGRRIDAAELLKD